MYVKLENYMKNKLAVIIIFLFISALAWAGDKRDPNASTSQSSDKIQANIDDVAILKSKVSDLELISDLHYKHYDEILEAQRFSYGINVTILIAIFAGGIALVGLINFGIIRRDLNQDIEAAVSLSRKEISSLMDDFKKELASNIQTATKELKSNFTQEVSKNVKDISDKTDKKFHEIQKSFEEKIKKTEANHRNALGRLYDESKKHGLAALWYARGLRKYIELESQDSWLKFQMELVERNLNEASINFYTDVFITDVERAIDAIPSDRFEENKASLMAIFSKRKQERLASKSPKTG
jgi:hypothetical protein